MKKILSIALVALLATSAVFAGFSGSSTIGLGYNFADDTYGFSNSNLFDLDLELATAEAEAVAEGDVYASIKANFKLVAYDEEDQKFDSIDIENMKLKVKLVEAKIKGANWYLSIKESMGVSDLAKSALDKVKKDGDPATYEIPYSKNAGFEASYADFVFGAGLVGAKKDVKYNLAFRTPEFDFDVVSFQIASSFSGHNDKELNAGISAKVGFDADVVSGYVASDVGFENIGKDWDVKKNLNADVAANLVISPVTVDAYYATKVKVLEKDYENYLSAQAKVDLNDFAVPVALTAAGKDLINTQDLSLKAEFGITEQLSADATVGYWIGEKLLKTEANVKYAADLFTVGGGVGFNTSFAGEKASFAVKANAFIESSTLVPGATLKLAYKDAKNFLKDQAVEAQNFGKIEATCKIAF